eukprot:TRINITY_DN28862_c0_g1_i1.p1 TRINITY_DN28862_c0_g1~~TRINITY_DN28862_c0_g1_i1.p1  ORF type:complete len:266 (+),score=94.24 TRINITY_DN28862_c0_g1_i1:32-799(+)
MGCGSSSGNAAAAPGQPQAVVVELSEKDRNAIAVQGLKDALLWALEESIKTGKQMEVWKEDDIRIKMPCMEKIDALKEKVTSVPVVGSAAAKAIDEALTPFEGQFAEAGVAVVSDGRTHQAIAGIINNLTPDNAIYLCREGGVTACVDYLKDFAKALLREALTPVVNDIMNDHVLTKSWKALVSAINKGAALAKMDELDFDLDTYVYESALNSLMSLMMRKEKEIRDAPAQAVSWAVQQCFGAVDPKNWKKTKDG